LQKSVDSPHSTIEESSNYSKKVLNDKTHLQQLLKMKQRGRIEIIMGPMFAGKSTELLRRVNRLEISGKKCLNVKYAADKRYEANHISTHDKVIKSAVNCKHLSELGDLW
jgi:thymidine kinase